MATPTILALSATLRRRAAAPVQGSVPTVLTYEDLTAWDDGSYTSLAPWELAPEPAEFGVALDAHLAGMPIEDTREDLGYREDEDDISFLEDLANADPPQVDDLPEVAPVIRDWSRPDAPGTCYKCSGSGIYAWGGTVNGVPAHTGDCFACRGTGRITEQDAHRNSTYWNKYAHIGQ